jgi:NitT/TauT family transport system ATP-binding protein
LNDVSSDSGITLSNVSRTFVRGDGQRVTAVDSVNLAVPEGEFVCLVGHSGCGKSTLLQMVSGLMPTSGGTIAVGSKPVTGPSPERGFVFQKDSVFPWMRVIDNV